MRWVLSAAAVLLATAVVVASGPARAPERLSDTGLYAVAMAAEIAPANRMFSPQYPLWTDGAVKTRWVYLPAGRQIDASDPNAWTVPVGTKFWKLFEFGGRKVETRFIWRASPTQWVFATYVWNAEGTEAFLAPAAGVRAAVEVAPGKPHNIPSATDCTACHGTTRPGPLGFTALQLSPDRDPNAIHGEPLAHGALTLQALIAEGRLAGAGAAYARAPRIAASSPRTRAVLGYLLANCGSCHNGRGEIAAYGPTIRVEDLLRDGDAVAASLVGHQTKWQIPGRVEGSVLVDAEAPDQSALLVRLRSRSPSTQMPPLGTVLRDAEAVAQVSGWIRDELGPRSRR